MGILAVPLASPEERLRRIGRREARAWGEYLAECREALPDYYGATERHAFQRLKGILAECEAHKRRISGVAPPREVTEEVDGERPDLDRVEAEYRAEHPPEEPAEA